MGLLEYGCGINLGSGITIRGTIRDIYAITNGTVVEIPLKLTLNAEDIKRFNNA